jgi:hypothetical protein
LKAESQAILYIVLSSEILHALHAPLDGGYWILLERQGVTALSSAASAAWKKSLQTRTFGQQAQPIARKRGRRLLLLLAKSGTMFRHRHFVLSIIFSTVCLFSLGQTDDERCIDENYDILYSPEMANAYNISQIGEIAFETFTECIATKRAGVFRECNVPFLESDFALVESVCESIGGNHETIQVTINCTNGVENDVWIFNVPYAHCHGLSCSEMFNYNTYTSFLRGEVEFLQDLYYTEILNLDDNLHDLDYVLFPCEYSYTRTDVETAPTRSPISQDLPGIAPSSSPDNIGSLPASASFSVTPATSITTMMLALALGAWCPLR